MFFVDFGAAICIAIEMEFIELPNVVLPVLIILALVDIEEDNFICFEDKDDRVADNLRHVVFVGGRQVISFDNNVEKIAAMLLNHVHMA